MGNCRMVYLVARDHSDGVRVTRVVVAVAGAEAKERCEQMF